jgi:hypothetical protein
MSSLLDRPGDDVANRLIQLVHDVVGLINDKGGAAKRLAELAAATAANEAKIAEAKAATKEANEEVKRIKAELAAHDDAMLRARQAHEKEVVSFEKTRGALLDEATRLRDQARADADVAAMKLKELNSKLAAIQSAAAA